MFLYSRNANFRDEKGCMKCYVPNFCCYGELTFVGLAECVTLARSGSEKFHLVHFAFSPFRLTAKVFDKTVSFFGASVSFDFLTHEKKVCSG